MLQYKVLKPHVGDKLYKIGDIRTVSDNDAKQLLSLGIITNKVEKTKPKPTKVTEANKTTKPTKRVDKE